MEFVKVENGAVTLNVAVQGEGPLILCVHGWPELWYSWRHQLAHFAARGYKVAAMDVRGYGASSKPPEIAAYSIRNLASDAAAVIDALGGGRAILFGHDWGAPIVWNTALLHPAKVLAVAGLSVPYFPRGEASFLTTARLIYAGRFFYQLYFQAEGVAEAELEADVATSLRKIYFALSGEAADDKWIESKPADAKLLDGMVDPQPFPAWLSAEDLRVYVEAFRAGGFRGPLNRYRAQEIDFADLADHAGKPVTQPACFIGGERDAVRRFIPGGDLYADPGAACADFRGKTIVPGAGHWVQQEAPAAVNAALEGFLAGL
jgi:pimeloyl-ACP methyl ester carboxylesterase